VVVVITASNPVAIKAGIFHSAEDFPGHPAPARPTHKPGSFTSLPLLRSKLPGQSLPAEQPDSFSGTPEPWHFQPEATSAAAVGERLHGWEGPSARCPRRDERGRDLRAASVRSEGSRESGRARERPVTPAVS